MRISPRLRYLLSGTASFALLAGCSGGGGAVGVGSAAARASENARTVSFPDQLLREASVIPPGLQRPYSNRPSIGPVEEAAAKQGGIKIFVSDASNNVVDIFNSQCKLIGQLPGFSQPQGLAVNQAGKLYLADTNDSRIVVFAKGYKGPPKILSDAGQYPAGVAVDGRGNIGVTNILTTSGGPGSVTFYDATGKQGKTISGGGFARIYFDAFDDRVTCIWTGRTPAAA